MAVMAEIRRDIGRAAYTFARVRIGRRSISILGALPKGNLREVGFDLRGIVEVVCENVQSHMRDDFSDFTIGEACAAQSLHVRVRSAALLCNQFARELKRSGIGLPPALCLLFVVGQLILDRFQVLIGFLQARPDLVDGPEDGNVIVCYAHFGLVFTEELLNDESLFEQGFLRRIIRHVLDLGYEIVPCDVAHDGNDMPAFLPVQKIETTRDQCDKQQSTEN